MPDPRPRPRYRLALIGIFAAFSLALVALGVRLGTAGVVGGTDRGPAQAGVEPTGAVVDLAPATPEPSPVIGPPQDPQDASRAGNAPQPGLSQTDPAPAATGTAPSPAPQPTGLPVPTPEPVPLPQPPAPVPPPTVLDPVLAPVAPVLDALLGGSGGTQSPLPTLPAI